MKILVTGAGGFIGRHVARMLVERGDEVVLGLAPGESDSGLRGLPGPRLVFDVRDLPAVRRAMRGAEAVVHLAAVYLVWAPDYRPMYQVNVQGTRNVLEAARREGVRRVVHTSSIAAVGLEAGRGFATEDTAFNQHDIAIHYALSKHYSERIALRAAEEGLDVVVVNPAFPFGPGDDRPTPTGLIILNILRGHYFAHGPGGMNAVDVRDVALGHLLALDRGVAGRRYLLTGHNLAWGEFYDLVKEVGGGGRLPHVGLPYPVVAGMGRLGDLVGLWRRPLITSAAVRYSAQYFFYDCSRARDELGYRVTPVQQGLQDAIRWFRGRGELPGGEEAE